MFVSNPKPFVPQAKNVAAALAIATLGACVDEPTAPAFDDAPPDVPLSPSRALHGMDQVDLDRLEREAQLGHPSSAGEQIPGTGPWLRDDEMDKLLSVVPDSTRPNELARSPARLDNASNASSGTGRRLDLDIPEVCHRDSPALDFERGWLFFDDDCDALLAAMDQLRGTVALNWDTATVMTEWDGVVLGTFGAERLYLHNRGLDGSIPPELGALDNLEVLSLGRNSLTGELPPELGSMRSLERLYLQDNDLTGEIPKEWGGLTRLKRLYLWRNQLTGEIPKEMGSMRFLERLNLGGNRLTGRIPPELGSLRTYLVDLHLWANELTGPIPAEFGNLYYLEKLSLSRNKLTGEIPSELAGLRNLEALWLYENQLTGPIPTSDSYGAWEELRVLWLYDNELSGSVPAELGNTDLGSLAISDNARLAGPLPLGLQSLLLNVFYWHGTELCSPAEPSFQAWLAAIASIDEDNYSGGRVCDSESGNRSPVRVNSVDDVTLKPGDSATVDASDYFRDPDGDALTYTANSSSTSVATASVSGNTVTVKAVADGSATIRVTARDPGGLAAEQTFSVTVAGDTGGNQRPVTVGTISAQTLKVGESESVNASSYFSDPDGDALTYTASSSRTSVATTSVSGRTVTVEGVAEGTATIRITATDPGGLSAAQTFSVNVEAGGDDYEAFSGLKINNDGSVTLKVGGITLSAGRTGCISGGATLNGKVYDYHWTAWQRNTGSGWNEVSGSRQTGELCGYDLTSASSGTYRLVGDMTLAGVRGKYKSENEVTK